ncbi:MAG: glycosyltransferase family 4 protein [Candidatus Binatia bacterium]
MGVTDDQVLVLHVGRIMIEKGLFELVEAISLAGQQNSKIASVIVGSKPAFDETVEVQKKVATIPGLNGRVKLLPECKPEKVWEYLCAADVFAFPSHNEGMPNSLLEAMAMGLPSIAFAIPPVNEIEAGTGALITVPPLDPTLFSEAVLRLAARPDERLRIGEIAKAQVMDRFVVRRNMAKALEQLSGLIQERKISKSAGVGR